MTNPNDLKLQHLLDVYGADQRRWPVEAARQHAGPAERDAGTAALALREAAALDEVLARAPVVPAKRQQALADRIMAQVQAEAAAAGAAEPTGGNVVIMLPPRTGLAADGGGMAARPVPIGSPRRQTADWRAAAALAAALVLGVGVGMSGSVSTTFQAVAETVGVGMDRSVLAFNDEQGDALAALDDEDVL
jgi:hypothetical protein